MYLFTLGAMHGLDQRDQRTGGVEGEALHKKPNRTLVTPPGEKCEQVRDDRALTCSWYCGIVVAPVILFAV